MDININNDSELPFDLYGDLEDAYDDAEREGDVEVVETLDAVRLWDEKQRVDRAFLYKLWMAIFFNIPEAQDDVGHAFFWSEDETYHDRERCEWMDRPNLAQYWYKLAAEEGYAPSQNYLAALYCPDTAPLKAFKLGRFARHWWEAAAKQKLPNAMRNLARCLRCGKCCCCDRDVARADALENEACEIDKQKED